MTIAQALLQSQAWKGTNAIPPKRYTSAMQLLTKASGVRADSEVLDATVQVIANGAKPEWQIPFRHFAEPGKKIVLAAELSMDGRFLAAAFADRALEVFQVPDGKVVLRFTNEVLSTALSISSNGQWLAAIDFSKTPAAVNLWRTDQDSVPVSIPGGPGGATAIAFSPNSRWLAMGRQADPAIGSKPELAYWDLAEHRVGHVVSVFAEDYVAVTKGRERGRSYGRSNIVTRVAFNRSSSLVSVASDLWKTEILQMGGMAEGLATSDRLRAIPSRFQAMWTEFTPDGGSMVWRKMTSPNLYLTDLGTAATRYFADSYNKHNRCLFSTDGRRVVFKNSNPSDCLHFESLKPIARVPGHVLGFHPDGGVIAINEDKLAFQSWQLEEILLEFNKHGIKSTNDSKSGEVRFKNFPGQFLASGVLAVILTGFASSLATLYRQKGRQAPPWINLCYVLTGIALVAQGIRLSIELIDWSVWHSGFPGSVVLGVLLVVYGALVLWAGCHEIKRADRGEAGVPMATPWFVPMAVLAPDVFAEGVFLFVLNFDERVIVLFGLSLGILLGYVSLFLLVRRVPRTSFRSGWTVVLFVLALSGVAAAVVGALGSNGVGSASFAFQIFAGGFIGILVAAAVSKEVRKSVDEFSRRVEDSVMSRLTRRRPSGAVVKAP